MVSCLNLANRIQLGGVARIYICFTLVCNVCKAEDRVPCFVILIGCIIICVAAFEENRLHRVRQDELWTPRKTAVARGFLPHYTAYITTCTGALSFHHDLFFPPTAPFSSDRCSFSSFDCCFSLHACRSAASTILFASSIWSERE